MRVRLELHKHSFVTTICLILIAITTLPLFAQDMKPLSSLLAKTIWASGRKTAAVVDFTDLQGNVTELGRFLAEELSIDLVSDAKDFAVIDRTHLKSILQEHRLAITGLIDLQTARKIGQIAGVDAIVTGTMTLVGNNVRISAKVLDPATAKMIGVSTAEIPKTRVIEELLGRSIGSPSPPGLADGSSNTGTRPLAFISENDLLFSVDGCRRSADLLTCAGSITSKYQTRRSIRLGGVLADNQGNQYSATAQIGSGIVANAIELWPELPVRWSVSVHKTSADAKKVTVILSTPVHKYGNVSATPQDTKG